MLNYAYYIGYGSTSIVFGGMINNSKVAVKWLNENHGQKELDVIKHIKNTHHLLLPLDIKFGYYKLVDIVGLQVLEFIKKQLILCPKRITSSKSFVFILPLMDGTLNDIKLTLQEKDKALYQLLKGYTSLKDQGFIHGDLYARNFFYYNKNGIKEFLLGDFGKITNKARSNVKQHMIKIINS